MNKNYILVTPMKNEEENIDRTIQSILNQKLKPKVWVIVNDASDDGSSEIVSKYMRNNKWIYLLNLSKKQNYDIGIHYSEVCIFGFKKAFQLAKKNKINYEYVALIDADTTLNDNYFEKLISKFEKNDLLGLASGNLINLIGNKRKVPKVKENQVCGTGRMWTKKCFQESDGYTKTCSPDTVSQIKANLRNYQTKRFNDIDIYQHRETSTAEGIWNGYKSAGYRQYYIYVSPLHAFFKSIKLTFNKPFYLGLAYFVGYFGSLISGKERTNDEEIKKYNSRFFKH